VPAPHGAGTPAPPGSALAVGALTAPLPVMAVLGWHADHRCTLRLCPLCSAIAVRAVVAEELAPGRLRLHMQCGQCGVWRRAAVSDADLERHERALERDRRRLGSQALRLAARRARRGRGEFRRALRSEIVGADDFVARARVQGRDRA